MKSEADAYKRNGERDHHALVLQAITLATREFLYLPIRSSRLIGRSMKNDRSHYKFIVFGVMSDSIARINSRASIGFDRCRS